MNKNDMTDFMRTEMWVERVEDTISSWQKLQGIEVPDEVRISIVQFMRGKIKKGINKGTLMKAFMQIGVTSLIYIKMKRMGDL
jgi:hypothetical protein